MFRSPAHVSVLVVCLATLLAAGCKRPPRLDHHGEGDAQATTTVPPSSDATAVEEAVATLQANFRRVHFPLDSHALDDEARAALDANAAILREFAAVRVEVQGHADSRGTVDYNLALGMRRAGAVVDHLRARGVVAQQLSQVTMGEEMPLRSGATEAVWSVNRRAEFRVLTPGQPVVGTTELASR